MTTRMRIYPNLYDDVFDAILQTIADCGFRKESTNRSSGHIVTSTGISLRSWGERMEIQVSEADNGTEVYISSSPRLQLIDWGKSSENIDSLFAAIERHL